MYFVYILQCCDRSYYVGLSEDVANRVGVHNAGLGPAYTARRLPVRLVYQDSYPVFEEAVRCEKQLKGWSRAKKEAFIAGDAELLSNLAACRQVKKRSRQLG